MFAIPTGQPPATPVSGSGTVTGVDIAGLGSVISWVGGPILVSGTITAQPVDPGADALIYFNNTSNTWEHLPLGTGLAIAGGLLVATGAYSDEQARDTLAAALVAGTGMAIAVDDALNTITLSSTITQYTDEQARDVIGAAIVAGAGLSVVVSDVGDTITFASTITQYTDEQARDAIGAALVAGSGISITVNDAGDTILIASTITQYIDEMVDDKVALLIQNGAGITWSYNDAANTLTPTVTITQYTDEMARDAIGAALVAGTNITLTVNDAGDTITIAASGAGYSDEQVDDRVAVLIQNGTGITWSYNDSANTLTPTVTITQYTDEMARDAIGAALVAGANITVTVNDAGDTITIAGIPTTAIPPFKNRFYNGEARFDQINEGAVYTLAGGGANVSCLDGWTMQAVGAGTFTTQRVADPDNASLFAMKIACTVADASIAAADNYNVFCCIEGYDMADLKMGSANAQQITISFDMKFPVTGTYGVSIRNNNQDRYFIGTVTQLVANATESKTVTLTLDVTGTWLFTNGRGIQLAICLAAGSNLQATGGVWAAGNFITTSAQANFMSANTNVGYIKNLQIEKGAVATEFERVPYPLALIRCQRFYEKSFDQGVAVANNNGIINGSALYDVILAGVLLGSTAGGLQVFYAAEKRALPTMLFYNPSAANGNWRNPGAAADSGAAYAFSSGTRTMHIGNPQVAGDVAGARLIVNWTANSRLS